MREIKSRDWDKEEKIHVHKIKPVKFFDIYTYQCGCGMYFSKEQYDKEKSKE